MTNANFTLCVAHLCLCSSRACHRWNIDIDISTRTRSRVGFSFLTLLLSFFIITQASWGCVACSDWAWKNTLYYIKDHKHNGIYININYDQNPGTCIIQMIGAYWVFDVMLVFFLFRFFIFLRFFLLTKNFIVTDHCLAKITYQQVALFLQNMYRNDLRRSSLGYLRESDITGGKDVSLGSNLVGLRFEGRPYQPQYSARISNSNAGQSLTSIDQAYGGILNRVRYTMQTTGSASDALGGTTVDTARFSSTGLVGATGIALRQSGPVGISDLRYSETNPLDSRNINSNGSMVGGTGEAVKNLSPGGEANHQPKAWKPTRVFETTVRDS